MKIAPLTEVNGIAFGSSADMLITAMGEPSERRTNSLGLLELCYPSAIYRFGGLCLEEATLNAPAIEIAGIKVPFTFLGSYLHEHDPSCFEKLGFIVSPAFGIAYDPEFPSWVTAFPHSGIALWQSVGRQNA